MNPSPNFLLGLKALLGDMMFTLNVVKGSSVESITKSLDLTDSSTSDDTGGVKGFLGSFMDSCKPPKKRGSSTN